MKIEQQLRNRMNIIAVVNVFFFPVVLPAHVCIPCTWAHEGETRINRFLCDKKKIKPTKWRQFWELNRECRLNGEIWCGKSDRFAAISLYRNSPVFMYYINFRSERAKTHTALVSFIILVSRLFFSLCFALLSNVSKISCFVAKQYHFYRNSRCSISIHKWLTHFFGSLFSSSSSLQFSWTQPFRIGWIETRKITKPWN